MKQTLLTVLALLALTLSVATFTTRAQQIKLAASPTINCGSDQYTVKEHDVLLLVTNAKTASAADVRRLADNCYQAREYNRFQVGPNANGPFTYIGAYELATRLDSGETPYVKFRWVTGECFAKAGLGQLVISNGNATPSPSPSPSPSPTGTPFNAANTANGWDIDPFWLWLAFVVIILLLLLLFWKSRWLSRRFNAERAGDPMVNGGIREEGTAPGLVTNLLSIFHDTALNNVQIMEMQAGRAWGFARVGYRGWQWLWQPLWGQRVYRVLYQISGGPIQTAYTLMACGNLLRQNQHDILPTRLFWWRADFPGDILALPQPAAEQQQERSIGSAEYVPAGGAEALTEGAIQPSQPEQPVTIRMYQTRIVIEDSNGNEAEVQGTNPDVTVRRDGDKIILYRGGAELRFVGTAVQMPAGFKLKGDDPANGEDE